MESSTKRVCPTPKSSKANPIPIFFRALRSMGSSFLSAMAFSLISNTILLEGAISQIFCIDAKRVSISLISDMEELTNNIGDPGKSLPISHPDFTE